MTAIEQIRLVVMCSLISMAASTVPAWATSPPMHPTHMSPKRCEIRLAADQPQFVHRAVEDLRLVLQEFTGQLPELHTGSDTTPSDDSTAVIEIALGVLLAGSITSIFAAFPVAIVGAMMMLVGVETVKFARDLRFNRHLVPVVATLAGSLQANMAVGFAIGLAVHYLLLGKDHRHEHVQR